MTKRFRVFREFIRTFIRYALHIREVIGTLFLLILLAAFVFSIAEKIRLGDAIYFAFITALSVGYGDITPQTAMGKLVSVCIGLMGMLFVGITVAIATRALADTSERHLKAE